MDSFRNSEVPCLFIFFKSKLSQLKSVSVLVTNIREVFFETEIRTHFLKLPADFNLDFCHKLQGYWLDIFKGFDFLLEHTFDCK